MPDKDAENTDQAQDKWITIGGKKVKIPAGEDGEEMVREQMPSVRGMKESNTKEAQKAYVKRYDLLKSIFNIRDEVVFNEYKKSGIISGFRGDIVTILSEGRIYSIEKNSVFKKEELIDQIHWDTMTNADRVIVLKDANIVSTYNKRNWGNLPFEIRSVLKELSPAGTTTATTGVHNPVYNPIHEEIPLSQRIEEEMARQHDQPSHTDLENGKGDNGSEKKGKD